MFLTAKTQTGAFAGYYTGRAGEAWVSADRSQAFSLGAGEAQRKAALFNSRAILTGLTFEVDV